MRYPDTRDPNARPVPQPAVFTCGVHEVTDEPVAVAVGVAYATVPSLAKNARSARVIAKSVSWTN